jgi:hypothetical protein
MALAVAAVVLAVVVAGTTGAGLYWLARQIILSRKIVRAPKLTSTMRHSVSTYYDAFMTGRGW